MTQEQRVTRGTIAIFILSMLLLVCLCVTATLAYFAGTQTSDMTLILGGPVRVAMKDRNNKTIFGKDELVMEIKTDREFLLPGMGIDMQAIAYVSSSQLYPTKALLRAKLDVTVTNLTAEQSAEVEEMVRNALAQCLTYRIDSLQDGWVLFEGDFYYCSRTLENGSIVLLPIDTSSTGNNIPFIDGTFQFPTKYYTNEYAHAKIEFKLTFQAIQEVLVDSEGERVPNTLFNVKNDLDYLDRIGWEGHTD